MNIKKKLRNQESFCTKIPKQFFMEHCDYIKDRLTNYHGLRELSHGNSADIIKIYSHGGWAFGPKGWKDCKEATFEEFSEHFFPDLIKHENVLLFLMK